MSQRIWAFLSDEEAAEVTQAAAVRGMKPSALARFALLAFVRQPVTAAAAPPTETGDGTVIARLEALAATLDSHVATIGRAVPVMEEAWIEHEAVRGSLRDIAIAVGTLAGSIEPPADETA